jgi:hypothetical protein
VVCYVAVLLAVLAPHLREIEAVEAKVEPLLGREISSEKSVNSARSKEKVGSEMLRRGSSCRGYLRRRGGRCCWRRQWRGLVWRCVRAAGALLFSILLLRLGTGRGSDRVFGLA